jgi:signal transduction histidine kinase
MLELLTKWKTKFFGGQLELRVRLFNILLFSGFFGSLTGGVIGFLTDGGFFNLLLNAVLIIFSIFMLFYSFSNQKYQRCYLITIIFAFFIVFPLHFIDAEGYHGGMLTLFMLATLFTMFLFDGKKAAVLIIAELVLYTLLCIYAYCYPDKINLFVTEADRLIDIIVNFWIASSISCITMTLYIRLYRQQQRELEVAKKQSEEYANMKSKLFAEMSHKMRTPITVMSVYAQFAVEQIRERNLNEQTLADLATISEEAKRLADIADGTLKLLMASHDTKDNDNQRVTPVDIGVLAKRLTQILKPVALRVGKKLTMRISKHLPKIYGNTDELTQLIWNILQNAITHTRENIELTAAATKDGVKIAVTNDGAPLEPALLPHIFEWGISNSDGGNGIGLAICRDIAYKHNGDISAQNGEGGGTCMTVTLKSATRGFDDEQ